MLQPIYTASLPGEIGISANAMNGNDTSIYKSDI
jgi:hypothetical protein